jgi:biotin transporter BioY
MVGILITFVISYIIAYLMRGATEKDHAFKDAIIITIIVTIVAYLLGDNML